jgi:putrescine aminotransferase
VEPQAPYHSETASARDVFTRIKRHLPANLAIIGRLAGRGAVEIEAQGSRVRLSDGRHAIDFGSYAVTLLGHGHPDVVAAVRRQLDLMPTATRLLANPVTASAAATLTEYVGGGLTRVYFGANGTDVVEAVLKLARLATGRARILAVEGAFHGKSLGALALTHHARYRSGLEPHLVNVTHLPPTDPGAVSRAIAHGDVAALIFEPVQGENGVRPLDLSVLRHWCTAAAAAGVFVIADEIQTGLRRCGERSLALAAALPVDAVLLGKPLGGGVMPLSAAVCGERLYAPLIADPMVHTATFAGHPLACAALPATLDAIETLAVRGTAIAASLGHGLTELRRRYPALVRDVRGSGLLWALEMNSADTAGGLVIQLAQDGLIVSPCMSRPSSLRLLPPMVATDADLREALDLLDCALGRLMRTAG